MLINKFDSKIEHRTVDTIIIQIERAINREDKYIDLNPIYQRDVVWNDEKQSNFINSVIRGIIPNNLILNLNTTDGKETCLDGKQRITSLVRFKKNEISCNIFNDDDNDNDNEECYFYSKIPQEHIKNPKCKILSISQRNNFLNKTLIFITYTNLSYSDQVDIFTRIQYGIALTEGEKLSSAITDENINKIFNEFCDEKKKLMSKFNSRRDNHKIIITNIMMIHKTSKFIISNKTTRNKFLKDQTIDSLRKLLNEISPLINFAFSDEMLGNKSISYKISTKVFYAALFWMSKHKYDLNYKNLIKNKNNQYKIRSVIRKTNRLKIKGKHDNIKNKLLSDYKKINDDELSDEENETEQVEDDTNEEENEVVDIDNMY